MHIPIQTNLPRLDRLVVEWRGRHFSLPYLYRDGTGGPSMVALNLYLYGDHAAGTLAQETPLWEAWFKEHFPMPTELK